MRTTLTLDPDVARLLEEEAHRQRKPFKHVVNERTARPYRVRPHKTTLRPGIDAHTLNRLADELEEEAAVLQMRSDR